MFKVCYFLRISAAVFLCLAASKSGFADYIQVTTGPTKTGTKFITVKTSDGKTHDISVPVTAGWSAELVQSKIIDELNLNGITATEGALGLISAVRVTGIVSRIDTDSGQTDTIADLGTDIGPILATIGLGGPLSGLDSLGNPSSFTGGYVLMSATLGHIMVSTTLSASDFAGGPTISAVLQQEYAHLSSQLQVQAPSLVGGLSLDLANSQIVLAMPGGLTLAAVTSGTTDLSGTSNETWTAVPEPSTIVLIFGATALLPMLRSQRRWRRRQ